MAEKLVNVITDTLASTLSSGAVLCTPTVPSNWPTVGNYRILIDLEVILVTSNDLTQLHLIRAQDGTTATSHAAGATIKLVPTAAGYTQWLSDNLASISTPASPRTSVTVSYLTATAPSSVFLTVLTRAGSVLRARSSTGVALSGVEAGVWEYSLAYTTIAPNLEVLLRWDEGNPSVYTPDEVWWPAGAGSVWRSGTGAPSNGLGVDNDFYLDLSTGNLWQRQSGVYVFQLMLPTETTLAAAPTTGAHLQGERVWNSAPDAGGNMGWVCTTAGTPGTWKPFGMIGV